MYQAGFQPAILCGPACLLNATGPKPVLQFAREKFLAGKTRALLLLVGRLYCRGQDQLDGRSKLHGTE